VSQEALQIVAAAGFAVVAVLSAWWLRLGLTRELAWASARAAVQLTVVGALIALVFRVEALAVAFVAAMLLTAALTSGGRLRIVPGARRRAAVAIGVPALAAVGLLLLIGAFDATPRATIPTAGILIGGAMTAATLTGRRLLEGLEDDAEEIEARLSLGDDAHTALRPVLRRAVTTGLVPAIDQTRSVGLVSLPGTFVGLVLGGASPAEAARVQLTVLLALLAVEVMAALTVARLGKLGVPHAVSLFGDAEVLDHPEVGRTAGEVQVHQLYGVRGNRKVERVGQVSDLHPLGDAADPADVRLNDIGAALRDQLLEAVLGVLVLAGGDGDGDRLRDGGQPGDVVGQDRLLEPADVEVLEAAAHRDGLLGGHRRDVDRHVVVNILELAGQLPAHHFQALIREMGQILTAERSQMRPERFGDPLGKRRVAGRHRQNRQPFRQPSRAHWPMREQLGCRPVSGSRNRLLFHRFLDGADGFAAALAAAESGGRGAV